MGLFSKKTRTLDEIKASACKSIAYVGLERGDFLVSIARIALGAGLKVAIIDNSISHDIYEAFKDKSGSRVVERGRLTVVRNGAYSKDGNGFDLVMYYWGYNTEKMEDAEYLILAASPDGKALEAISKARRKAKAETVVLRDAGGDVSVKDVCHILGITDSKKVIAVKADMGEYKLWSRFTRELSASFKDSVSTEAEVFIGSQAFALTVKEAYKCLGKGDLT